MHYMMPDYGTTGEYTFGVHHESDTCMSMSVAPEICRRSHTKSGMLRYRAFAALIGSGQYSTLEIWWQRYCPGKHKF